MIIWVDSSLILVEMIEILKFFSPFHLGVLKEIDITSATPIWSELVLVLYHDELQSEAGTPKIFRLCSL